MKWLHSTTKNLPALLDKDGGSTLIRNVGNYLPVDTV